MAADAKAKSGKKKTWKWKNERNIFQVGSKEKGQAFADLRKKKALREYKKLLKKTKQQGKPVLSGQKIDISLLNLNQEAQSSSQSDQPQRQRQLPSQVSASSSENNLSLLSSEDYTCFGHGKDTRKKRKNQVVSRFSAAEIEHKKRKQEKEEQMKMLEEKRKKRDQELIEKVKKRRETYAKLNKKTKRGQPVMSNHMNLLLEKIQSQS